MAGTRTHCQWQKGDIRFGGQAWKLESAKDKETVVSETDPFHVLYLVQSEMWGPVTLLSPWLGVRLGRRERAL